MRQRCWPTEIKAGGARARWSIQWSAEWRSSEPGRYRLRLRSRPPPQSRDEFLGLIGRISSKRSCRSLIQGFPVLHGRPFVLGFRDAQEQVQSGPDCRSLATGWGSRLSRAFSRLAVYAPLHAGTSKQGTRPRTKRALLPSTWAWSALPPSAATGGQRPLQSFGTGSKLLLGAHLDFHRSELRALPQGLRETTSGQSRREHP